MTEVPEFGPIVAAFFAVVGPLVLLAFAVHLLRVLVR